MGRGLLTPTVTPLLLRAVVLVLSEEFITTPYPMEELQLLIGRHVVGSKAVLLPVPWDINWADVKDWAAHCKQAVTGEDGRQQDWAHLLEELQGCAIQGEVGAFDLLSHLFWAPSLGILALPMVTASTQPGRTSPAAVSAVCMRERFTRGLWALM
jgi:hypothetical protein